MHALGLEPEHEEIKTLLSQISGSGEPKEKEKDREAQGSIDYNEFLEIMRLKMNETNQKEIDKAFKLFAEDDFITTDTLRMVASELGEQISEDELNEMVREANMNSKYLIYVYIYI